MYHQRRLHNAIKTELIHGAARNFPNTPLRVLDLACGKGGDLPKFFKLPSGMAAYVGVDIAKGSLDDAGNEE